MEKLRVSKRQSEIQSVLKSVMSEKRKVLVWQKEDNSENRKINYAQINNLNFETKSIGLIPMESSFEDLDKQLTLYFRSEYSSLLFKSDQNMVNKKMIIVPFPKEVRLIEKRNESRYKFKRSGVPRVGIELIAGKTRIDVMLADISKKGSGIVVSSVNKKLFNIGTQIQLNNVEGLALPMTIIGTVRHITFITSRNSLFQGSYKLGIEFDSEIPLEPILERLSK